METAELLEKLEGYGADISGIRSRFMGDMELYARCFYMMLEEQTFISLEKAVAEGDASAAFDMAHAVKGMAANMGLTPLYERAYLLVEELRARGENVRARYEAVAEGYAALRALAGR